MDRISETHLKEFEASAIASERIGERGYQTVANPRALPEQFTGRQRNLHGWIVPIRDVTGQVANYQIKPDNPRTDPKTGKPRKYETAAGGRTCIDIPAAVVPHLRNPDVTLWITEGCKKVDSGLSNGIACIVGLLGVDGWSSQGVAVPDWKEIALKGRRVHLAFDSDAMTKASVRGALERLARYLAMHGADVRYVLMPPLPDGSKCGLDDWFASGRSVLDLEACVVDTLPGRTESAQRTPVLISLAEVEPQQLDWLWRNWLPEQMLTILGGYGGDGKSTLLAYLISKLTRGGTLPDGTRAPLTNCLMLAAEDDPAYAIRPRLDLHNADASRVHLLKGTRREDGSQAWPDLRRDADIMRAVISAHDIGLVAIDPLSSYMPKADRNSEGDVRDALMPLQVLMEETGVAVIGVMHVGKADVQRRAAQRLLGSTAFTALARTVWMVHDLPDEHQPGAGPDETPVKRKVLGVVKANYSIPPRALAWSRPMDGPLQFHGPSPVSIDEAFAGTSKVRKQDEAEEWLADFLKGGMRRTNDVEAAAERAGISPATLKRARTILGVKSHKGREKGAPWYLHLPADPGDHGEEMDALPNDSTAKADQAGNMSAFPESSKDAQRTEYERLQSVDASSGKGAQNSYTGKMSALSPSTAAAPLLPTGTDGTWSLGNDDDWEVF